MNGTTLSVLDALSQIAIDMRTMSKGAGLLAPLRRKLARERHTVGSVIELIRDWEAPQETDPEFLEAKVALLAKILHFNQRLILVELFEIDRCESLFCLIKGDDIWASMYAQPAETLEEVDEQAAQALAVILLTLGQEMAA
jgi:hypothetical protein